MPLGAQVKLLHVVQEGQIERVGGTSLIGINLRMITVTNRDLHAEIATKNFREDLFYCLNVISIQLPPLRERCADVPQLAEFFLERASNSFSNCVARRNVRCKIVAAQRKKARNISRLFC